jgi:long-chain acyl-CoA synthetase
MSQSTLKQQTDFHSIEELQLPFMTFLSILRHLLQSPRSHYDAFVTSEFRLKNDEFVQQVIGLATALKKEWKLKKGDKVALLFWNQPEFFVSFFALRLIGAVPVPINILMTPQDMGYVLAHAEITGILATEILALQLAEQKNCSVEQLPFPLLIANAAESEKSSFEKKISFYAPAIHTLEDELDAFDALIRSEKSSNNELAFLIYTSGTTGFPKGVMLSERNILSNLAGFQTALNIQRDGERFLLGLPVFHCYGLICALFAIAERATVICVPRFNPKQIVDFLKTEAVTVLPLVPTMFTVLLQAAKRKASHEEVHSEKPFPTLHTCISGGAALPETLLQTIQENLNVQVLEGYGLSETSPVIAVNTAQRGAVAGAVGQPLVNLRLRLVNHETGDVLPIEAGKASAEGEIQVAGDSVMLGYYKNEDETAKVLCADGWFKTGDLGHIDAEGLLRISGGRLKDLIIRAGENIAPLPIERILVQHEAVAHVAVLPLKDEKLGEALCACIELMPESKEIDQKTLQQELSALVRQQLSASYTPDAYRFFDELPKNPTGKIVKKQIVLD